MATREVKVYEIINNKAGSNMFVQGLSGALGFPFTLFADAGVFLTHYGPMMNSIREIYGMKKADEGAMKTILSGCGKEVIADLVVDKVVGNIPLIGIIGHECGHIAMGHVIYHTVVDTIRLFGYSIPTVGDLVYKAVEYPLHAWHRRSEITADRAGLLCCRSLENAQKTLLQLESGFTDVEKIDLGEYLKNSREFLKGSWVRRVGELKSTHPLTPKRILALALFAHSRLYHDLCADEIGKKDDTAGLLDENMLASETEAILKVV